MKIKWLLVLISLILIIAVSDKSSISQNTNHESVQITSDDFSISSENRFVTSDEPIIIQGNEGFELHGWPGSGTENDPYTLANVNLDLNTTSINILNTNAHFVIENVTLSTSEEYYGYSELVGIRLFNVKNGIIRRTDIRNKDLGILLEFCSDMKFENATFEDVYSSSITIESSTDCKIVNSNLTSSEIRYSDRINISDNYVYERGFFVEFSNNLQISNCTIKGNRGYYYWTEGVSIQYSENITISEIIFEGQGRTLVISNSQRILVNQCQILDSYTAIDFYSNSNCTVSDTIISESDIYIYAEDITETSYEFANVTIDEKPIAYYGGIDNLTIDGTEYSYLILQFTQNIEIFNEIGMNISSELRISHSDSVSIGNVFANEIKMESSNRTSISNTTISGDSWIHSCNDVSLLNSQTGYLETSSNTDFLINNSQVQDLEINSSYNVTIKSTVISGYEGTTLSIRETEQVLVKDTILFGAGILLEGGGPIHYIHQFSNVSVNGKPLGYFVGVQNSNIALDEYGQVILVLCDYVDIESGEMRGVSNAILIVFSSNIFVSGLYLADIEGYGLKVVDCNDVDLYNITIFNGIDGIRVEASYMVSVTNCNLIVNGFGLYLQNDDNILIDGNSIIGGTGIEIMDSGSIVLSENHIATEYSGIVLEYYVETTIVRNRISAGGSGIHIYYIAYWEQDLELVEIIGNTFYQCDIGINIGQSYNVKVIGNHIMESWSHGIYLYGSESNTIAFNEIAFSEGNGMLLGSDSQQNHIYGNLFHHNADMNAEEDTVYYWVNYWNNDEGVGNFWDDYNGEGEYQILGGANSSDRYPLNIKGHDYSLPLISNPNDITVNSSDSYHDLTWVVWIDQPVDYVVYVDGVEIESGTMTISGMVSINLTELPQGNHNFTLSITTESGIFRSSKVTVTVGSIFSSEFITLTTMSVIVITIVLLEIRRRRSLN